MQRSLPAALAIAFGLFLLFVAIPAGVKTPMHVQPGSLGPADLPRYLAVMLICAGAILLAESVLGNSTDSGQATAMSWRRAGLLAGKLLVFIIALNVLGMVPAIFCFVLLMLWGSPDHSLPKRLAIATLFAATIYVVFVELGNTPLPLGLFEQR